MKQLIRHPRLLIAVTTVLAAALSAVEVWPPQYRATSGIVVTAASEPSTTEPTVDLQMDQRGKAIILRPDEINQLPPQTRRLFLGTEWERQFLAQTQSSTTEPNGSWPATNQNALPEAFIPHFRISIGSPSVVDHPQPDLEKSPTTRPVEEKNFKRIEFSDTQPRDAAQILEQAVQQPRYVARGRITIFPTTEPTTQENDELLEQIKEQIVEQLQRQQLTTLPATLPAGKEDHSQP